jgi:ATP-binding cassette, subfamily F, member 3
VTRRVAKANARAGWAPSVPAPVVQAEQLAKAYGARRLFEGASFQVEDGEKVAIVGPNGAGKSTLLRVLSGRERADHGLARIRDDIRVHFFEQHPEVPPGATVRDLLAAPVSAPAHLRKEMAELEARIADPALYEEPGYERVLERYAAVEREAKLAMAPPPAAFDSPVVRAFGFSAADLDQAADSLSGGERTRLFLARTLGPVKEGDLVVLDEPTNHLDVDTIEWLEEWIMGFAGTVLVVAHDRAFLDNVAGRVLEVTQGRVTPYPGNYTDYVTLRDESVERRRREHEKAVAELKRAEATIQQFRHQKRFDGQYASRMKMVERHRKTVDRAPDPVLLQIAFALGFDAVEKSSNEMIHAAGIRKGYGDGLPVLDGADIEVQKGDRIGLVGANGTGKSTLLKILTGRATKDAGTVRVAPGVKGTYLAQGNEDLVAERTLREEVLDVRPLLDDDAVKALLGRFGFVPEVDMSRRVSTLSGGERGRMALLKAVLKPSNLLILDEPTNHMDLEAREIVVRALNSYPGTMIVVSHDRFLLDMTTNKTAVVSAGKVHVFPGSFTETRHLHPRPEVERVVRRDRYFVRKKFTDWTTGRKYLHGEEPEFSADEVAASLSLRNALKSGWLERS